MAYSKPIPIPTEESKPFWEATKLGELEEGPRLMSNVVGLAPDQLRCDMPVEVVFEPITGDISLPKFRQTGAKP